VLICAGRGGGAGKGVSQTGHEGRVGIRVRGVAAAVAEGERREGAHVVELAGVDGVHGLESRGGRRGGWHEWTAGEDVAWC